MSRQLLSVAEAAAYLNIGKSTVHNLLIAGVLGHHRPGGVIRISLQQIEEYLRNVEVKPRRLRVFQGGVR